MPSTLARRRTTAAALGLAIALATRLVRAVAAGVRDRGDTPFLHAAATNTEAIGLYESIGFTTRRRTTILQVRTPGTDRRPIPA